MVEQNNKLQLRFIERTKISKYAPGVDPHDPNTVPYEVVETESVLSAAETAKALAHLRGMYQMYPVEFDKCDKLQTQVLALTEEVCVLEEKREQLIKVIKEVKK